MPMRVMISVVFRLTIALSMLLVSACDEQSKTDSSADQKTTGNASDSSDTQKQQYTDGGMVRRPTDDQGMQAAFEEARTTAVEARGRWSAANDREMWCIKWGAETESGDKEYVWICPTIWTEHRIEGELMSAPIAQLICGAEKGSIVAFPADELVDWAHQTGPDSFEGYFTDKWLR